MTSKPSKPTPASGGKRPARSDQPEWADGLRQLYDSVVEEPLPDNFKDLLSKLDGSAKDGSPTGD